MEVCERASERAREGRTFGSLVSVRASAAAKTKTAQSDDGCPAGAEYSRAHTTQTQVDPREKAKLHDFFFPGSIDNNNNNTNHPPTTANKQKNKDVPILMVQVGVLFAVFDLGAGGVSHDDNDGCGVCEYRYGRWRDENCNSNNNNKSPERQ
jgi:hypothetical protein